VLGRTDVCVVDEADGSVAVRAAFDLGEADVPERERREHLEEHGGALSVMREDDAGLEGAVGARDDGFPREHDEARHVPCVILDAVGEDVQALELSGARRGNGGGVAERGGRDVFGGAGGVVERLARDVETHGVERELALRERLRVGDDAGEQLLAHAGQREEAVVDGELHLADDVEAVAEQEVVVAVDAAAEGVLDGEHGAVGDPELHGLERDLELVARDGVAARVHLGGGRLAVGVRDALVRDAQLAAVHQRGGGVADAERARLVRHRDQIQCRQLPVAAGGIAADEDGAGGLPVGAAKGGGVEARGSASADGRADLVVA
jgi:hypothetical protein